MDVDQSSLGCGTGTETMIPEKMARPGPSGDPANCPANEDVDREARTHLEVPTSDTLNDPGPDAPADKGAVEKEVLSDPGLDRILPADQGVPVTNPSVLPTIPEDHVVIDRSVPVTLVEGALAQDMGRREAEARELGTPESQASSVGHRSNCVQRLVHLRASAAKVASISARRNAASIQPPASGNSVRTSENSASLTTGLSGQQQDPLIGVGVNPAFHFASPSIMSEPLSNLMGHEQVRVDDDPSSGGSGIDFSGLIPGLSQHAQQSILRIMKEDFESRVGSLGVKDFASLIDPVSKFLAQAERSGLDVTALADRFRKRMSAFVRYRKHENDALTLNSAVLRLREEIVCNEEAAREAEAAKLNAEQEFLAL